MARLAVLLTAALLAVAGCGDEEGAGGGGETGTGAPGGGGEARPEVRLRITVDEDGDGGAAPATSRLTCSRRGGEVSGPLGERGTARELCAKARAAEALLAETPPRDRICTQVYGGPQTARIAGTIDGRAVERRFARDDGCEITAWDRAVPLLPRTRGAATPAPPP